MADRVDRVGQRFGDYGLIRWLGGGSFGDVYLGEHVYDNTRAAVKVCKFVSPTKRTSRIFALSRERRK